ncbi:MAG: 4-(cytidine 5'-diphospho)-2-C-methyl-D-erythritol kinase [Clostridia bacterium]|nr:4-(cytidine 5'-diphospho)-2-C-methyl-D-erythritol kinase [Clostridia bacterium]
MEYKELKAYAKINFILNVLGLRNDGFHEVETVMQAVDLYDRIRVGWESTAACSEGCASSLSLEIRTDCAKLSTGSDNLAYKAAVLMHELFHKDVAERITVDIEKKLPIAAGLAGGSADAAAVMVALAELWGIWEENQRVIAEAAAVLGADVPFCVLVQTGKTACIATGTGTQLRPVDPLDCKVLLSTPEIELSTKDVYDRFDQSDAMDAFNTEEFLKNASHNCLQEAVKHMGNHLQSAALKMCPDIEKTLEWAKAQNYPLVVQMSGSGPTVFALYPKDSPMESVCTCHSFNKTTFFVSTLI